MTRRISLALCMVAVMVPAVSGSFPPRTAVTAPPEPGPRFVRRTWTTEDGLPQNSVNAILQTRDGYLWVGTFGGLARFDGIAFTVFNSGNTPGLKSNRILSLYEDRAGVMWIGAETGEVMSLTNGVARTFTTRDGLPGGLIWCFHEDAAGTMWIGTTRGLVRWQPGNVQTYTTRDGLAGDKVWSISEGEPGHLWLGTDVGLVDFSNGKGMTRLAGNGVRLVHPRPTHGFWLATNTGLMCLTDGKVTVDCQTAAVSGENIRALADDRAGNVWVGYFDGGVVSRVRAGTSQRDAIDLGAAGIRAIISDTEGNVWVGTVGAGLVRLRERKVTVYAAGQGLPSDGVRAIAGDGDRGIWATTDKGLVHIGGGDQQDSTVYTVKDGLPQDFLFALHRDREGTLWIGGQGLIRLKDRVFTTYAGANGLASGPVHAIAGDGENNLWIGTENGLTWLRHGRFVTYRAAEGLVHDDVRSILPARDGSVWVGTVGGLSHFRNGRFASYTSDQGLANNFVRTMLEQDDGTLWIGTYGGGLSRLKDGRLASITTRDGLFDDFISQIVADDRGHLWMSSNRGIFRVSARALHDVADGRNRALLCISYGVADGMTSSEGNGGNQPAGWRTPDGKLWFAMVQGLVSVDPEQGRRLPPPVLIERVVVDRQPQASAQTVQIGPDQDSLEIHYTGLSFARPEQLRFKYRLTGLDHDWIEAGTRRVAYYSHIPPGRYVFSVVVASSEGVWNDDAATLPVVVVPPFWKTRGFLSLVLAAAAGMLIQTYRRRVGHLKKAHAAQEVFSKRLLASQESERQRIAAELHDGLGQSLLMIKNRAFLASTANGDHHVTRTQLEEITLSASQAIEEVREISYNLRPYQLDRFGLTRTLRAMFTRVSDATGIHCSAEIDPIDGLFSKDEEISIYRIVQESLNNIVKHSGATAATLLIERGAGEVRLRIFDNGQGFGAVAVTPGGVHLGGFGLTGMAERVRMLAGACLVESTPGQGTTITIRLHVKDPAHDI